jgi:hypothetical protein
MYLKLILVSLFVITMSCKKGREETNKGKSTAELLTQKEWILTATGFDGNNNGVLDASENTIQDCYKDNSYIFHTEGAGFTYDNSLSCGGSPSNQFNWKLLDNDTKLEIGSEHILILQLNENEMVLNPQLPGLAVKFFMIYRH